MTRVKVGGLAFVLLVAGLVAGCGGGREKGRNSDLDRPKAAETRK